MPAHTDTHTQHAGINATRIHPEEVESTSLLVSIAIQLHGLQSSSSPPLCDPLVIYLSYTPVRVPAFPIMGGDDGVQRWGEALDAPLGSEQTTKRDGAWGWMQPT